MPFVSDNAMLVAATPSGGPPPAMVLKVYIGPPDTWPNAAGNSAANPNTVKDAYFINYLHIRHWDELFEIGNARRPRQLGRISAFKHPTRDNRTRNADQ